MQSSESLSALKHVSASRPRSSVAGSWPAEADAPRSVAAEGALQPAALRQQQTAEYSNSEMST